MPIINNPKAPWIYVEEEGGGDDSRDTAAPRAVTARTRQPRSRSDRIPA